MKMGDCLAVTANISDADRDTLLGRVDEYTSAGMPPSQAQVAVAKDMLAEIEADQAMARNLVREQHGELFSKADAVPAAPRSELFTNPDEYRGEPLLEGVPMFRRVDQTQTPEFKRWFGDSKVTTKGGRPLKMYHGTDTGGFSKFRTPSYFTRSVSDAENWGADTEEVYLSLKNPVYIDNYEAFSDIDDASAEAFSREGYDGAVHRTAGGAIHMAVAFRPEQIKSATGNRGTFDDSADIRFSRRPTYADRPILNGQELHDWAVAQGIKDVVPADKMHITVAYSKAAVDRAALKLDNRQINVGLPGAYKVERLGEDDALVLRFDSAILQDRWMHFMKNGASWDFAHTKPAYKPHVTLSYSPQELDLSKVGQFPGQLKLGPERVEDLKTNWSASLEEDLTSQGKFLEQQAQQAGYPNVDEWLVNDYGGFEKAAGMWREDHPAEMMFARAPAGQRGAHQLRAFGWAGRFIEAIQDRYNRWKQAIADVKKQGGIVTEANDFYRAEERYWGKVGSRIEDFKDEVAEFVDAVAADKLTLRDVQLYAYAKHAKERNAYLRTKRGPGAGGFDSWSGMSDDDAQAHIDSAVQAGLQPTLERHSQTLQKWIQGTRDVMLDEGLITQDEWQMLSGFYQDYVPLRGRPNQEDTGRGTGSGFNIRGKESKKARGRYSEADQIIEYIVQDRSKALIRAGKNEVLRSFLQFVIDNPSPNLWKINAVEMKPMMTTDASGNQVIEEQPSVIKGEDTVSIKDGGREVYVQILDRPLLEQMRNMHIESVGKVVGLMLMAQRMLGKLYTSLSPTFTVLNFARDAQAATFGMLDETGFAGAARLWKNMPRAMASAFAAEFGRPSQDYQLYRATGGKTGFFDFKTIDQLSKDLTAELVNADRSVVDPRVWGPKALELIEKINGGVENGTRFATFLAAREEGKSLAEAASVSKNITVNFNRKGTWTPQLSAFFLFFNPAVQGSARIAQALASPKVLAVLGAGMGGMAMLALQNAAMGDDDDGVAWWDKIPSETKDRNIIIVLPPTSKEGQAIPGSKTGRYLKIPMPYGYNFFATVANQAVDTWRHSNDKARGRSVGEASVKTLNSFLGAYLPVSEVARSVENPKSLVLVGVPDFLNPIAQSLLNVNSFGRPMYPEDSFNSTGPDSSKFFAGQAGTIFQRGADALNTATGGNKYKSGGIDITPATMENLARAYGGGPTSFALDLMNALYVRQSIGRPDLDARRLPFMKQLYGQIDGETDRMIGYETMRDIDSKTKPLQQAMKDGDFAAAQELAKDAGAIANMGDLIKETRARMAILRKEELAIIASKDAEAVKYSRLMTLDENKRRTLQQLNRAYVSALRQPDAGPRP